MNNIKYVPRHIGHHGAHSGYDILFNYLKIPPANSRFLGWLAKNIPKGLAWRLWAIRPQPTASAGLSAEIGAVSWIACGSGRICHFIYGEDTYFLTPLWKNGANCCIATFHYPPDRLMDRINPGSVRQLDAAIIVGKNQRTVLERFLPANRIFFCPHPVDTEFFSPAPNVSKAVPERIICTGSLFREYRQLVEIHLAIQNLHNKLIETHVVGLSTEQKKEVEGVSGVVVHQRLSDLELRDLYRSATIGCLPLQDATANNALLEMQSCGLPVVATNVGGISDYTALGGAVLCAPNAPKEMIKAIIALLGSEENRETQGMVNRNFCVENLALSKIEEFQNAIYMKLREEFGFIAK